MAADSPASPPLEWAVAPYFDVTGRVLMGLVDAPAPEAARRPDHRSQIDVEIHGPEPEARAESSLAQVKALLSDIEQLRSTAESLASKEWHGEYDTGSERADLFVEGFELHADGLVRVLFDFGDLDLFILDLQPDGRRTATVEH